MSTFEDLRSTMKQTLENNGSLDRTRAKIRADIFAELQNPDQPKPRIPYENLLINELILEYLNYNNHNYAALVVILCLITVNYFRCC
jgi:lisH domain-containing protein FOPNL